MSPRHDRSLYRLVYTSIRKPECDEAEIQNILNACRRNNPGKDITGVLLHSNRRFIQYLEGPLQDVQELFELIKDDPRHAAVNKRDLQPIEERLFPSWEMGYKNISRKLNFNTTVLPAHQEEFDRIFEGEYDFSNKGLRLLQLFFGQEESSDS